MAGAQGLTTAKAAAVLGVSASNLRRWVREGKFDALGELPWDRNPGFQKQRIYSREWIEKAAAEIGVDPEWSRVSDSDA